MKEDDTQQQLLDQVAQLRQRIGELEAREAEHERAEEEARQRNRELELLNRASQAFNSTLDLDEVLATVFEETRQMLAVAACSAWLIDPETDELVCRQATGRKSEYVRGWRLAPGQGIAGWVVHHGESLIVPDTRVDSRHFTGVSEQIDLEVRCLLAIPLRVKGLVIGVLEVVAQETDRFGPADLRSVESLSAIASAAIENARLYEQARRDAAAKAALLREVNHRVKNNLSAILGVLYAEQRYIGIEDQIAYRSLLNSLITRVQSLATVHSMLTATEWSPLPLGELAARVIHSSLQMLPRDKRVSVEAVPSPVHVTADQAQNLALVLNELTTNTIKYGLQERTTANIVVRIASDRDTVQFEFRDDGPGYPQEALQPEHRSVGMDLVQNIVSKSLHGELSLYNDQGAVAIIRFKTKA